MKILDRYVLVTFLKNYLLSFLCLVGLYIVLDMLFNFQDLLAIQAKEGLTGVNTVVGLLKTIGDYYFYQIFLIFVHLSGIIPVVASAFTLMRMSRFNELSALLSSGVPLLRVTMPIIIASVVLNGLLLVDQEFVIPPMIPKLTRSHSEANQNEGKNTWPLPSMQDGFNLLVAARYSANPTPPGPPTMEVMDYIERDAQLRPVAHLTADKAVWDADRQSWHLENGKYGTGYLARERTVVRPQDEFKSESITPQDIALYKSSEDVSLLSTERINQLLNRKQAYGVNQLMRVQHQRFTQPVINIILLLLAIPTVLTRQPTELKRAATKCLILAGLCMGTVFLSQLLSSRPPTRELASQWPAIMAWVPIFVFGPISVFLLDRVET